MSAGQRADGALLERRESVCGFYHAVGARAGSVGEAGLAHALEERI
ncbi:hypothetical protein [Burkholderia savannae]|nr:MULTISPECIES: hypothetical protein [Burkholderia]